MLLRSIPSWTISHKGLCVGERKSNDVCKMLSYIYGKLPHLSQPGHVFDAFLGRKVYFFFSGESSNAKPDRGMGQIFFCSDGTKDIGRFQRS